MERRLLTLLLLLFALLAPRLKAQTQDPNFLDGEIYLKIADSSSIQLLPDPGIPALTAIFTTFGLDTIFHPFRLPSPQLARIYRLKFLNIAAIDLIVAQLQILPFIDYVEKVPLLRPAYTPNDLHALQWSLRKIRAEEAWDLSRGNSDIVVAVVDNAVRTTHDDLIGSLWVNPGEIPNNNIDDDSNGYIDDVNGADLANADGNPCPPSFGSGTQWDHGTHCAGIAAAHTDNALAMSSMGFGVRLMAVKAGPDASNGDLLSMGYEGLDYAVSEGANVISMSWGSTGNPITGNLLVSVAAAQNVLMIGAAGNAGTNTAFYPASYTQVVSVGATDSLDTKSTFSNYHSSVDVMAPGSDIFSTMAVQDNTYGIMSGTSMACPLVAGLGARIWAADSTLSATDVRAVIESSCINIDGQNPSHVGMIGHGRIDAYAALLQVVTIGMPSIDAASEVQIGPVPVLGRLHVRVPLTLEPVQARVRDLQGRVCTQHSWMGAEGVLDLSALPAGCYLLEVQWQGGQHVSRVLVGQQ